MIFSTKKKKRKESYKAKAKIFTNKNYKYYQ